MAVASGGLGQARYSASALGVREPCMAAGHRRATAAPGHVQFIVFTNQANQMGGKPLIINDFTSSHVHHHSLPLFGGHAHFVCFAIQQVGKRPCARVQTQEVHHPPPLGHAHPSVLLIKRGKSPCSTVQIQLQASPSRPWACASICFAIQMGGPGPLMKHQTLCAQARVQK